MCTPRDLRRCLRYSDMYDLFFCRVARNTLQKGPNGVFLTERSGKVRDVGGLPRGADGGSGATGMMVTPRVADSWGGQGEAPFSAPQAKKILGPKCRFTDF